MKQSLTEIFKRIGHFGSDIGCNDKNGTHTYTETYDKVLEPYRNGCTFMEIGLAMGDSIKLFDEYFENSNIIGVDISVVFEIPKYKNDVKIIQADATKVDFLNTIKDEFFDVVLDDADHTHKSQIATFNLLKHKMKPRSIYIIEDILSPEQSLPLLKSIHDNCEVYDFRNIKGRFDDMILIYRF